MAVTDPVDRVRVKVRELAKLSGETFTRGQYSLTVLSAPTIVLLNGVPVLDMHVELRRDGKLVPIDGHLRFVNPPIKVWDGTWRTVTGPDGQPLQVKNFTEDLRTALRNMVADAVLAQVRALR